MDLVGKDVDVLAIAETKLDKSFPEDQFFKDGFKKPFRLDKSSKSGGILVYVRQDIPARRLTSFTLPNDIQVILIELNLSQKWVIAVIYCPHAHEGRYFLDNLSQLIDFYSQKYERFLLIGDYNLEPVDNIMEEFLTTHNLHCLNSEKTCYKSPKGICIDLMLTNRRHCFKYSHTIETGLSDFHLMIYTMLKTTFTKLPYLKNSNIVATNHLIKISS